MFIIRVHKSLEYLKQSMCDINVILTVNEAEL